MIIHVYDWVVLLISDIHKNIIYNQMYSVSQVSNSDQSWMFRVKCRAINTDTSPEYPPISSPISPIAVSPPPFEFPLFEFVQLLLEAL